VPSLVPSDVAPRAAAFDPQRSVYNLTSANTRRLRAAIAAARNGGTAMLRFPGDSTSAGYGSGQSPSIASAPVRYRQLLAALGVPIGGTGWVFPFNNETGTYADSRWTLAGGWAQTNQSVNFVQVSAGAATATFTSDIAGTVAQLATFGVNSGTLTLTVDSATPANGNVSVSGGGSYSGGTITPGPNSTVVIVTVTGLSSATHTIAVTTTGATTSYVVAARVHAAAGLEVTNAGLGGSEANLWVASGFTNPMPVLNSLTTSSCDFLSLGLNDIVGSVAVATYQSQMTTAVNNGLASNDVVLWVPPTPNPTNIPTSAWQPYRQALYNVSDSTGVPLVDMGDRWGAYATATANGYHFDNLHPSGTGYADIAAALLALAS
jgi:hypothetical protein